MKRDQFLFLYLLFIGLSSCRPHKYISEGQWLKKNKIEADKSEINTEELEAIVKQRANRKILLMFHFHTWAYHYGSKKPEKKLRKSLKEMGEPVTVVDSNLTEKSRKQIELFLHKKGYFHAKVNTETSEGKKATIKYHVKAGEAHKINKIRFEINDTNLLRTLRKGVIYTSLLPGDNYDETVIEKERERMTNVMLDNGYYEFSKEYIYFQVDTNLEGHKADVKVVISNANKREYSLKKDSIVKVPHSKFRIGQIFINTRYNYKFPFVSGDTMKIGKYIFLNAENLTVQPHVILRSLFFNPDSIYNKSKVEYSYNRLSALRVFRAIRIRFEKSSQDPQVLNAFIDLSPAKRRSLTFEGQGTHRNRSPGISGSILFNNRNSFRGAESFVLGLNGGLEYQNPNSLGINADTVGQIFNTQQAGVSMSISTPTILQPFKKLSNPKYLEPETSFSSAFQWQSRPGYSVYTAHASFDYSWKKGDFHRFKLVPTEFSYVWLRKEASFETLINESTSAQLAESYIDHLISATRFVYTFSNQTVRRRRNFKYLRTSIESCGNNLRAIMNLSPLDPGDDNSYQFLGVRFAQYLKTEADFRLYNVISKKSDIVYRIFAGIGIPFTNLSALPFEKSFFAGGANSIRAWNARTLGPGSVSDTLTNIDNIGNFQLEANIEYRFPLYRWIKGALFIDIGNVWTNKAAGLENGDFQLNRFYKELAVAGGFGTRFDFDFFLIRLDLGIAFRDPAFLEGERWLFQSRTKTETMINNYQQRTGLIVDQNFPLHLNLGIGFPF